MDTKNQQIEFRTFSKEKSDYSYLGNIKNDSAPEPSSINVVFSHQSVIIICICAIMLLVASFSLGVEKGKLLAKNTGTTDKAGVVLASAAALPPAVQATMTQVPIEKLQDSLPAAVQATEIQAPKEVAPLKTGGFTIQIASVKTESAAKAMADFLSKRGLTSFTKRSGKYITVLAGNFAKKEEAQVKMKELKKTYTDCYIKPL